MILADYSSQVDALRSCSGFAQALRELDRLSVYTPKIGAVADVDYQDVRLVKVPYMGEFRLLAADIVPSFFRTTICDYISRMQARTVLEVGCGTGDLIASLARDNPSTSFIAADMSESARECTSLLANIARVENLAVGAFDMTAPDWRIHPDLIYMTNTLGALDDGAAIAFFQSLPAGTRICAWEPPDKVVAHTWPQIKSAVATGIVRTERVIKDMIGRSPLYSLSLIQMIRC